MPESEKLHEGPCGTFRSVSQPHRDLPAVFRMVSARSIQSTLFPSQDGREVSVSPLFLLTDRHPSEKERRRLPAQALRGREAQAHALRSWTSRSVTCRLPLMVEGGREYTREEGVSHVREGVPTYHGVGAVYISHPRVSESSYPRVSESSYSHGCPKAVTLTGVREWAQGA